MAALTADHLKYIWEHLREYDRVELELQYEDADSILRYADYEGSLCGLQDNVPFCAWGTAERHSTYFHWFFATELLEEQPALWRIIHRVGKEWLAQVTAEKFGKRGLVQVWEEHKTSIRWLERLGFERTKHVTGKQGQRLVIMERNKIHNRGNA